MVIPPIMYVLYVFSIFRLKEPSRRSVKDTDLLISEYSLWKTPESIYVGNVSSILTAPTINHTNIYVKLTKRLEDFIPLVFLYYLNLTELIINCFLESFLPFIIRVG